MKVQGRRAIGLNMNTAALGVWILGIPLLTVFFSFGCGGGNPPVPETLIYISDRALDGSDGVLSFFGNNVWVIDTAGGNSASLTGLDAPVAVQDLQWSRDGRKIALAANGPLVGTNAPVGNLNIWAMNSDGSGKIALTSLSARVGTFKVVYADNTNPAWSPDGTKVAYTSQGAVDGSNTFNAVSNVWLVNTDGSGATPLTKGTTAAEGDSFDASWSSNGRVVFVNNNSSLVPGNSNVLIMNADGSSLMALTNFSGNLDPFSLLDGASHPVWSPDGAKIAFTMNSNIWVANVDGSGATQLTQLHTQFGLRVAGVAWSPDDTKIVFASSRALDGSDAVNVVPGSNGISATDNIWLMNSDGSGVRPLTRMTALFADCIDPALSPDGTKIAFDSERTLDGSDAASVPHSNIWVMNADGSGLTPITRLTKAFSQSPIWRP